jgi:hypothetical protein
VEKPFFSLKGPMGRGANGLDIIQSYPDSYSNIYGYGYLDMNIFGYEN